MNPEQTQPEASCSFPDKRNLMEGDATMDGKVEARLPKKCCKLRESMFLVILGLLTHTGPTPVRGEGRNKLSPVQEVYLSQCESGQAQRDTWEERRSRHCLGKGTPPKEMAVHEVLAAKQVEKSKWMGRWRGIGITERPLDARLCTRHFTTIIPLAFQTAP